MTIVSWKKMFLLDSYFQKIMFVCHVPFLNDKISKKIYIKNIFHKFPKDWTLRVQFTWSRFVSWFACQTFPELILEPIEERQAFHKSNFSLIFLFSFPLFSLFFPFSYSFTFSSSSSFFSSPCFSCSLSFSFSFSFPLSFSLPLPLFSSFSLSFSVSYHTLIIPFLNKQFEVQKETQSPFWTPLTRTATSITSTTSSLAKKYGCQFFNCRQVKALLRCMIVSYLGNSFWKLNFKESITFVCGGATLKSGRKTT